MLYCKGADTVIFERLRPDNPYSTVAIQQLKDMASDGYRTLCCALTEINEDEYAQWAKQYHDASVLIVDRQKKIDAVCELIEKNLYLLGVTAIEDKLQEGVPETIELLARVNIFLLSLLICS